jgi:hypothetical protein
MKIYKLNTFYNDPVGSKLFETIKWIIFYFLLEHFYVPFFDPFGLSLEPLGIEIEFWFEFAFYFFIPWISAYYAERMSTYGAISGLICYLLLFNNPIYFLYIMCFQNIYGFIIVFTVISDIVPVLFDSESPMDDDD